MSWFKRHREDGRRTISGGSVTQSVAGGGRDRTGTDPETCFEVFRNHWQQAINVINQTNKNSGSSIDDLETVIHNFEQMMTLLVGEEGTDGMPGPIAHFLLETDVLENFCSWCNAQRDHQDKLRMEQLRMYELLISQSRQLLLIHRPVIRPLLRLLLACAEQMSNSGSEELEFRLVLVLHQICTCISQETVILESFFSTEANHGPAKFLIFSLLIRYIHREGPIGQRARDALLLLMTLSARHPHIGHYIAENSDFCPVLATGLSGLYSSLPRKINPPREDWYSLTEEDCQQIVDLQMFLNSLEFCNAVVQVAHPLVRNQLIKYIYTGFLVPVLGPALHQDICGLPIPLLDTAMFMNSRDEVMTATAYLDLFLRRISEPHLIRAFLHFVLMERHDDMLILESLISRINSNSKLSLVSLSLFNTLVDMNCEEIMFQLVFRYLIPCTHVMVSQRRSVRDLDLYGKSAEKFLSLRPVCCMTYPPINTPSLGSSPSPLGALSQAPFPPSRAQPQTRTEVGRSASFSTNQEFNKTPEKQVTRRRSGLFGSKREKKKLEILPEDDQKLTPPSAISHTEPTLSQPITSDFFSESSYIDYLFEARSMLERCAHACRHWSAPYDGEHPPPDSILDPPSQLSANTTNGVPDANTASKVGSVDGASDWKESKIVTSEMANGEDRSASSSSVKLVSQGNLGMESNRVHLQNDVMVHQTSVASDNSPSSPQEKDGMSHRPSVMSSETVCSRGPPFSSSQSSRLLNHNQQNLSKVFPCLDDLDTFLACLSGLELPYDKSNKTESDKEILASFDQFLTALEKSSQDGKPVLGGCSTMQNHSEHSPYPRGETIKSDSQTSQLMKAPSSKTDHAFQTVAPTKDTIKVPTTLAWKSTAAPSKTLGLTTAEELSQGGKVILSPLRTHDDPSRGPLLTPTSPGYFLMPSSSSSTVHRPVRYSSSPPNIGPFLQAVFGRLEGMAHNSLYANLLLTGIVSRLAAYPHPLLRSFLLNVNLVFQPTVKSLVQVLSSVRQRVDSCAVTTQNFSTMLIKARYNLRLREEYLINSLSGSNLQSPPNADFHHSTTGKLRAATVSEVPLEKKKISFSDLLFRRSPKQKVLQGAPTLQRVPVAGGGYGYHFINSYQQAIQENPDESIKMWNTVYCALILEEFLKELAALSLEHSVLNCDEGYVSS